MRKRIVISLVLFLFLSACSQSDGNKSTDATSAATSNYSSDYDLLEERYDVVVIGAGGGGLSAAIRAHDAGKQVAIFEKMPLAGGNTLKSSAGMNASQTKVQEANGIIDYNDDFFEESLRGGKNTNDVDLLRYLVDNSSDAIDWLDSLNIKLSNLTVTGGMGVKRTHRPEDGSAIGSYLVKGLLEAVSDREIPLFLNANVKEIYKHGDRVDGVQVELKDLGLRSVSSKSVVVATGGFGANLEMVSKYDSNLKDFVTTNQSGSLGDGIAMAQKIGAAVSDMDKIQIHPTVDQEKSLLITEAVRGEGAILVSQNGDRFVNELDTRDVVSKAIIDLTAHNAYLLFDARVRESVKAIDFYDEQGLVVTGSSVSELAKAIGADQFVLNKTIETWNSVVSSKHDPDYNRSTGMDYPLDTTTLYAIKIAPGVHHTMGGLKTNVNTEVLDENSIAIPGLFAAGEAVGGVHGSNRIGGNAVADIIVFGMQAGDKASEYAY